MTLEFNDAIEWFERAKTGQAFDETLLQLFLSVVAIHITSDLTSQTLADIAKHPDIM